MPREIAIEPPEDKFADLVKLYQHSKYAALLEKSSKLARNYPSSIMIKNLQGATFHSLGNYSQAILYFSEVIKTNPNYPDAYNNLGNSLIENNSNNEAILAFQRAISLNPKYFIAYNNLGKACIKIRDLSAAKTYLQHAIILKPNYVDALINLSKAYTLLNEFELAKEMLKKVIQINPLLPEAYNNLGTVQYEMKNYLEAINSYIRAIDLDTSNNLAKINLSEVLKVYETNNCYENHIINANNRVKKKFQEASVFYDASLSTCIRESMLVISECDKHLTTQSTQIYKRNTLDLNCKRHTTLFEDEGIIPQFCFECFKIQIDVKTVLDLIKLAKVLYDADLTSEPITKCMIELRQQIPGFYKAFIYCSGEEHAKLVLKEIENILDDIKLISSLKLKRGCSEFNIKFPEFDDTNSPIKSYMQYPKEWNKIEQNFDAKHQYPMKARLTPSIAKFCLSDLLVIQHWIDYAKGLGDPTAKLFDDLPVKYEDTLSKAIARSLDYAKLND